jgi:hypothetical protein
MKTTKRRKKKMRTANIFTISQRFEVTDWKYLHIEKNQVYARILFRIFGRLRDPTPSRF